ncbi:MAG: hypothetical protein LUH18_07315 [Oscillospiraceae bacterium]|nr:hypothetical protein [Oscillospiraceae bacterium]
MKVKKIKEYINTYVAKRPSRAILFGILLLNVLWFIISAVVISCLAPDSLHESGFWQSVFYTISMVLDAGCVSYVITDIGEASVGLIIACIIIVIVGMITFTGAVIGYVTNTISSFIENSKSGNRPLKISEHTVILNWNSRASEIINDLLYEGKRETIVILVNGDAEHVEREISDRIADTIRREKVKNRLTIIVREGDTFSSKALDDISILSARSIIILSSDVQNSVCKYDYSERREQLEHGNSNTIKTLVQVTELTSSEKSANDQTIVVEIEDKWTGDLVDKIIYHKEKLGKCNIIPVPVNKILGQILSQFSIMPELNTVYSELFSNKGAECYSRPHSEKWDEIGETSHYLENNCHAIPLTTMETKTGFESFYIAEQDSDIDKKESFDLEPVDVEVNPDYWMAPTNIIIIGHNSKSEDIMNGFNAFRAEWNRFGEKEIIDILIIDDKKSIEKHNYYRNYTYVSSVVEAEVYEYDRITDAINQYVDSHDGDTSILILSDDNAPSEDIDSNALTYLIYVQDIISERLQKNPDFDTNSIDVIVEILNPKNYDVVHDFSANNVVISNRYISKMVTQISEKVSLYEYYCDILTYDESDADVYESKELYIKPVRTFLRKLPPRCTAKQLIRAVYKASPDSNKAMVIGYVNSSGETRLFVGNQQDIEIELTEKDKLIIYSRH